MTLPTADATYLEERGILHDVVVEGGVTCVVLTNWTLPRGFDVAEADLLVRLPAGYPDVAPDMWWFEPAVHQADGGVIQATEVVEQHLGRSWQRWSRHFQTGQWLSGVDGLESYLALINRELERSVPEAAP